MIANKIDLKNHFFNSLVPFQPIEIRKDLVQSALYSCNRNWDKRHFFATAYAIKAIALSFFHSLFSLGKGLYGFAKNGVQFKFKKAFSELSSHAMFSLAHLSVAICAIHCTAVGFFFPKSTYQVFAPEPEIQKKNDLTQKLSFSHEVEPSNDDEATAKLEDALDFILGPKPGLSLRTKTGPRRPDLPLIPGPERSISTLRTTSNPRRADPTSFRRINHSETRIPVDLSLRGIPSLGPPSAPLDLNRKVIPLKGRLHVDGHAFQVRGGVFIDRNLVSIAGAIDGRRIDFNPIRFDTERLSDQEICQFLLAYLLPQNTQFSFIPGAKKAQPTPIALQNSNEMILPQVRDLSLLPASTRLHPFLSSLNISSYIPFGPTPPIYPLPLTDLDLVREQNYRQKLALDAPTSGSTTPDYETLNDDDDNSSVEENPLSSSFFNEHDLHSDTAAYWQLLRNKLPGHQVDVNLLAEFDKLKEMKDDQILYFSRDGHLTTERQDGASNALTSLELALYHTYGERLCHLILDRYELRKIKTNLLTIKDLKKILIGAAANVQRRDLESAFNSIKEGSPLSCLSSLLKEEIDLIQKSQRFDDLSPEQIHFLLSAFRAIPLNGKRERVSALSLLKKEDVLNSVSCREDLDKLHSFDFLEQLPAHGAMSISEHLAKWISYQPMGTGMIIACRNAQSTPFYLEVVHHFSEGGLQFTLLKPLNAAQNCTEIYALFQGTNCLKGAARDLETIGVGKSAFNRYSKELLEALFMHLPGSKTIKVIGHSLGGMDAQRFVLEAAKNLTPEHQVDLIQLEAHNAPRGEKATYGTGYYDVNAEFEKALCELEKKGIKTQFNLNYYLFQSAVVGDLVQQYGHVYLGLIKNALLKKNVIITTLDSKSSYLELHTALPYTNAKEFDKVERIERYCDDEANPYLGQVLSNNRLSPYTWFSYLPAYPVQKTLAAVARAIIYLKRAPDPYAPNLVK